MVCNSDMIKVLSAYNDGKQIQFMDDYGKWVDIAEPSFDFSTTLYRVKPDDEGKLKTRIAFRDAVREQLNAIEELLVAKNKKYGNSALAPSRVFSKADEIEQLKVRIDDKLSRISNQRIDDDEDAVLDLIGYLILLRVAQTNKEE